MLGEVFVQGTSAAIARTEEGFVFVSQLFAQTTPGKRFSKITASTIWFHEPRLICK